MHEMALAESVVEIVERRAAEVGAGRIVLVRLEIGALSHVEPQALRFAFEAVALGSIAEGAELKIARPPGRALCTDCGAAVRIDHLGAPCPQCGGFGLQVSGGDELRVRDMEAA